MQEMPFEDNEEATRGENIMDSQGGDCRPRNHILNGSFRDEFDGRLSGSRTFQDRVLGTQPSSKPGRHPGKLIEPRRDHSMPARTCRSASVPWILSKLRKTGPEAMRRGGGTHRARKPSCHESGGESVKIPCLAPSVALR
jgi:hypothetical protein